jgi:hypothetical protein
MYFTRDVALGHELINSSNRLMEAREKIEAKKEEKNVG